MRSNNNALISLRKRFQGALSTQLFGHSVLWLESVDSTNIEARKWAEKDAGHGSVVFADYQASGRGRHGRSWVAQPGLNLTFSLIIRPELQPDRFGLITLAASLAVRESIVSNFSSLNPVIKWPNDIVLGTRKCCGMLLESIISPVDDASYVVLGIGLNVNQSDFSDALSSTATSLMLECGRPIDRALLLADLLDQLEKKYTQLEQDPDRISAAYRIHLDGLNQPLTLNDVHSKQSIRGIFRGVDDSGALLLELESGMKAFHAGDVHRMEKNA